MIEKEIPNVGKRIRSIREGQHLSLRTLAKSCGLSANAISKIERGENSPTVASLHLLASALQVPITEFFHGASNQTTVHIKHSQRSYAQHNGMGIENLGRGLRNQQLEPFIVTVPVGPNEDTQAISHAGEEFVYCLRGELIYYIGNETYHLNEGDSLIFEATQSHHFVNLNNIPATILFVFAAQDGTQAAHQCHLSI